jgi:hypothetical protein
LFDISKMYNDDLFVNCPFIVIENKRHVCVKRKTPQKRNFVQKYGKYAPRNVVFFSLFFYPIASRTYL